MGKVFVLLPQSGQGVNADFISGAVIAPHQKITTGGTFRFNHKLLYIANSLVNHHIGLEETEDGVWSIYFNTVLIATLNERDYIIRG
ncbi:MAG: hypothetical protein WKF55_03335 [Gemmatimonadaceae bacterium]